MIRLPLPVWAPDPPAAPPVTPTPPPADPPADPPAPPPADPPKTSMQRVGEGVADPVAPADFPADWRERMAVGPDGKPDIKAVERLKRYATPADVGKAFFEADKRINSKGADVPMPDETKDAEGAKKWREERGIPADATGYKLPENVTKALTDADKPVLSDFTTFAHKKGASPAAVAVAAEWYTDFNKRQMEQQTIADREASSATDDELRTHFGVDFKPMMTVAARYANELFGVDGADVLTMARFPTTPDIPESLRGRLLGDIPMVMKGFAQAGLDKFGDVSFVGGEATKKTQDRLAELKGKMSNMNEWDAHPEWGVEYQGLLEAQQKRNAAKAG